MKNATESVLFDHEKEWAIMEIGRMLRQDDCDYVVYLLDELRQVHGERTPRPDEEVFDYYRADVLDKLCSKLRQCDLGLIEVLNVMVTNKTNLDTFGRKLRATFLQNDEAKV